MTVYQQISSNRRRTYILIALFIIIIVGLSWVFAEAMDAGLGAVGIAGVASFGMAFFSYYGGDKVALLASGAKGPIQKDANPYVYRMVENLAIGSGMQMPKIYLIEDPAPNAFATGRNEKHASIALTTGLIDKLENEELEGVIAHELSHIRNEDIKLMMVVLVLVGTIALLADIFLRSRWLGGDRNRNNQYLLLIGLVLAIFSPIAAQIIKLAISRQREYMADASGALMTRYPEGLARALEKIDNASTKPLRRANNATAHLYIANPFGKKSKRFLTNLFATHPPISERVKALRAM